MSKDKNRPRLGRGLSSLLSIPDPDDVEVIAPDFGSPPASPSTSAPAPATPPEFVSSGQSPSVMNLPIDSIRPNPHQPRREFNEASLAELAASLKSTGLVQPIVVKQVGHGYELIAGERRLRAAKLASMTTLPAIVRTVDSPTQAQMALVENIQREDLNPIDRAQAYRAIMDALGLTQGELAVRLGEDRSGIGHYLRLLDLTEPVRDLVRKGQISLGHAKLLAGIADLAQQGALAGQIVEDGLSVRALEKLLNEIPAPAATESKPPATSAAHIRDLEQTFTRHLGMKVQIRASAIRGKGKLIIQYATLDEFDSLKTRLGIETD